MSVNAHLRKVARASLFSEDEKQKIRNSTRYIMGNLGNFFGTEISEKLIFGSYSRGTILPRYADVRSDVDLMLIFRDDTKQPQSYLNRLKTFTSTYYHTSEIKQSHPTIRLELNHIMFELVPAIKSWCGTYQIPDKASSWDAWQDTDPKGFNQELTERNTVNSNLTKPLVRVLKYWNANNGYPFESYELEKKIVAHELAFFDRYTNLATYFYDCVFELTAPSWNWPQDKKAKLQRLQAIARSAKNNEAAGYLALAVQEINKIIPLK